MKLCKLSCDCDCLQDSPQHFDTKREYVYQSELYGLEGRPLDPLVRNHPLTLPDGDASSSGRGESGGVHYGPQWGLLTLSQPITASEVSCCTAASPFPLSNAVLAQMRDIQISEALFHPVTQACCHFTGIQHASASGLHQAEWLMSS